MPSDPNPDLKDLIYDANTIAHWIGTLSADDNDAQVVKYRREFREFLSLLDHVESEHPNGLVLPSDRVLLRETAHSIDYLRDHFESLRDQAVRDALRRHLRRLSRVLQLHDLAAPVADGGANDLRWLGSWVRPRYRHWTHIEVAGVAISHAARWFNVALRLSFRASDDGRLPNGVLQRNEHLIFYKHRVVLSKSTWRRLLARDTIDLPLPEMPPIVLEGPAGQPYEEWSSIQVGQIEKEFLGAEWHGLSGMRASRVNASGIAPGKDLWGLGQQFTSAGKYGGLDRVLKLIGFDINALISSSPVVRFFAPIEAALAECSFDPRRGIVTVRANAAPAIRSDALSVQIEARTDDDHADTEIGPERRALVVRKRTAKALAYAATLRAKPGVHRVSLIHATENLLCTHVLRFHTQAMLTAVDNAADAAPRQRTPRAPVRAVLSPTAGGARPTRPALDPGRQPDREQALVLGALCAYLLSVFPNVREPRTLWPIDLSGVAGQARLPLDECKRRADALASLGLARREQQDAKPPGYLILLEQGLRWWSAGGCKWWSTHGPRLASGSTARDSARESSGSNALANRLGIPVRRRPLDAISTQRRGLSTAGFRDVLDTLRHAGESMERSPRGYASAGEERLRDVLLVGVNAAYRGAGGAETFNKHGKTDLLLEHLGKRLLVAECKIWDGRAKAKRGVDQLLRNLTARDRHAAFVCFVRTSNLSATRTTLDETIRTHKQFVSAKTSLSPGPAVFRFHLRGDVGTTVDVGVLVIHLPKL